MSFNDPTLVARYIDGPPRFVPGFVDMQRMACVLLAERAPVDARVLVLGAGGGLELKAFAGRQPGWTFDGVDPSAPMLALARQTAAGHDDRIRLHEGFIDAAPAGPFDAAACLLTMHFMAAQARADALRAIHARLRPGSPFVVMHLSAGRDDADRLRWLARDAQFAIAGGVETDMARQRAEVMARDLHVLTPAQDEALLHAAGFGDIGVFYVGGAFRGWICQA